MNKVYQTIGTSKQNFHQRLNIQIQIDEEQAQLQMIIRQVRRDHPKMGAKVMYKMLKLKSIGRDRFIAYYNQQGYQVARMKNYRKTTNSNGVIRFPNLIRELELTSVNQVLVSDITYYDMIDQFYYLTFIMDLYSRKIKGYSVSRSLRTIDTTIPAIKMVLKNLPKGIMPILHSDGGGQYYSKAFLSLTAGRFYNSMCDSIYENAHAERLNGTIKNQYVKPNQPTSFEELQGYVKRTVLLYNTKRPHQSLGFNTPEQQEKYISE